MGAVNYESGKIDGGVGQTGLLSMIPGTGFSVWQQIARVVTPLKKTASGPTVINCYGLFNLAELSAGSSA